MANYQSTGLILLVLLALVGCDEAEEQTTSTVTLSPLPVAAVADWQLSLAQQAANQTTQLKNTTTRFLGDPTEANRSAWQQSWIIAHDAWLRASVLVPDETKRIDPWPIEPGFVDSLPAYPDSGIVNDLIVSIDAESLQHQHQFTDDSEVTLGFQVLEYYAFERDLPSFSAEAANQDRRVMLIDLVVTLLLQDQLNYSRQFFRNDGELPESLPRTYNSLLPRLQSALEAVYSEYRVGNRSRFSNRSTQTVLSQLKGIKALLDGPAQVQPQLMAIDPVVGVQFLETLDEAITLLPEEGDAAESESARALLLLAALTHQLEELTGSIQ